MGVGREKILTDSYKLPLEALYLVGKRRRNRLRMTEA
jgi:hypothetical protein